MGQIQGSTAQFGLNLNSVTGQIKPGQLSFGKNAQVAGFDGNTITYQNEPANIKCYDTPAGYTVIGEHNIIEKGIIILWLVNTSTGDSEIAKVVNCVYQTVINAKCLNFSIRNPIMKAVHKITSCGTEVYWPDGRNGRRYINLDDLPYKQVLQGTSDDPCNIVTTSEIDCNKLNVQPNFDIPLIDYRQVDSDGTMLAGVYQFAIQYSNAIGDPYTSFYSVTNPIPVNDPFKVTPDFNYPVGKSIRLDISNIDNTGVFDYFNVAVIKTVNNISSVDLVGTFQIQGTTQSIVYTGQSKENITLSINDIFEKFPVYDIADDITALQDILVWKGMTTTQRLNYQQIASKITLQWVSWKLPKAKQEFKDEINSADLKGHMRDEIYPFDLVFLLTNGYQTDRFPMVGRLPRASDLEIISNKDSRISEEVCDEPEPKPRWKVYNTGSVLGTDAAYDPTDECYQGPYQYGEFSYWESSETYPCNEAIWGDLQGKPIRHFKFPDNAITNHHDNQGNVYPLGIRIDIKQLYEAIRNSNLSESEKNNIVGVKIVRGNRANSKSVIAKGILFNVGEYAKGNTSYFYPNYPFNDLRPDPFILNSPNTVIGEQIQSIFEESQNVGGSTDTDLYTMTIPADTWKNNGDVVTVIYNGKFGNTINTTKTLKVIIGSTQIYSSGSLTVDQTNSFILTLEMKRTSSNRIDIKNSLQILGQNPKTVNTTGFMMPIDFTVNNSIILRAGSAGPAMTIGLDGDIVGTSAELGYKAAPTAPGLVDNLNGFSGNNSHKRFTFHSPDTSFYQPFLGNILKLETVEYGLTRSHFVQVKNHSKYRFPSIESYLTSLAVGIGIGFASGTYGLSNNPFNGAAAFTAFSVFNDIVFRLLPKKNMAYQFNSLGEYSKSVIVPNDGNKIRQIDIATYLTSGIQGVGDTNIINNYQRESSVYLRTMDTFPFPDTLPGVPDDNSRFTLGEVNCKEDFYNRDISSYYGSIKVDIPDQYGHVYSYQAVDTGYQFMLDMTIPFEGTGIRDVFGGDTFINKFAFKRKLPFFIDNRVGFPDESDVFYDELGNIGFPRYWFSTDIKRGSGGAFSIGALFGVKVNNFDCENSAFFYDAGKIYLFAYGIVDFFVESQVNVDYRQAYNAVEGDYFPHVGSDVPDDWLQEANVTIAYDNTYTYNKTFSKQNIENVFSTLPVDFIPGLNCQEYFPNKAVFSERQEDVVNYRKNNWLIYRPVSFYDFPLNYGKLISVDGIETRQLLARFENKSQLYNALLTANSSIGEVYLGQSLFNKNIPPIDFAETDTGFAGSQHKFLLRTEFGHITIDSKRGNIFLINGQNIKDLGGETLSYFLTNNLPFQLKESFPDYDIDNNFKGVGLHGVYDNYYDRVIITKLDYKPLNSGIIYNSITDEFTLDGTVVSLDDPTYFCNVSFTLSYWLQMGVWISFHSYLPKFYIADINKFHTGIPGSVWTHNIVVDTYNTFYGNIEPYVLEYPINYKMQDEILQSVKDYTKANKVTNARSFVQTDDIYFNKVIIFNDQQCSGVRNLTFKPQNNLAAYLQYPKYNLDNIEILFTKSDNFYNYNGFWDIVQDKTSPIWLEPCNSFSDDKVLNEANMNYTNRSFKKYSIRAKDCKIRAILDNRGDIRLISQFIVTESQISYK